jgi:hypothetical protein
LQAFEFLRDLQRPLSITPRQWVGVRAFLYIIARGYPRPYKSEITIATEMGVHISSVKRYVSLAKAAGVLTVTPNAGTKSRGNPRRTNLYHLVYDTEMSPTVGLKLSPKSQGIPRYPLRTTKGPTDLTTSGPSNRAGKAATTKIRKIPGMDAGEAISAANDRGYAKRRPRRGDTDPARNLVAYFLDRWEDAVTLSPSLATMRGPESRGEMTGYIRKVFIAPTAGRSYSEEEVRGFIDDFMKAAVRRTAGIKHADDQSAWRRFTGWWGRRPSHPDSGLAARQFFEEQQAKRLTEPGSAS